MRDEGVVRQSLDYTCGAAALATLINRIAHTAVSERDLLDVLADPPAELQLPEHWRETGVSFSTLAALADHYGMSAVGVELAANDLDKLRVAALAYLPHSDPPHFTVVTGIAPGIAVEIADPSWGNRRLQMPHFQRYWRDKRTGRGRLLLLNSRQQTQSSGGMVLRRPLPLLQSPTEVPPAPNR
jgi:predicted double-glycine peptidase